MAGVLDAARMRYFIAAELDVSVEDVDAFVLGGHGDTMVPLPRYATVNGIPLPQLLSADRIEAINDRTRKGGIEIVNYYKQGSAYYAPSAAVYDMVAAILHDKKKILPCAVLLHGEYGLNDLFVGVPARLGRGGMEQVIELELTEEETAALQKSAEAVRELVDALPKLGSGGGNPRPPLCVSSSECERRAISSSGPWRASPECCSWPGPGRGRSPSVPPPGP
jgi:malate dehydrogenase